MAAEKIGRYQITGELGRGAMGVVYRATDPNIGRTVALKTTHLEVQGGRTDELLRRFRQEARSAGTLNHPNIVTIYDAGDDDGIFYIAMEYVEGKTLQELLAEQRRLPADRIAEIAAQICSGLEYAHAHGVVHRDIKPANIMITENGTVKLMDFGIAVAGTAMTLTGQVVGTPDYMSPEQVRGMPLDGRSDLFSLGVTMYEMATGEKPFVGQSITTVIYKIINENPIPPRQLDPGVDPGISEIVTRALAKSPDQRFQNAREIGHALRNYRSLSVGGTSATATIATSWMNAPTMEMPAQRTAATQSTPVGEAPREPGERRGWRTPVLIGLIALAVIVVVVAMLTRTPAGSPVATQSPAPSQATTQSPASTPATPPVAAEPKPDRHARNKAIPGMSQAGQAELNQQLQQAQKEIDQAMKTVPGVGASITVPHVEIPPTPAVPAPQTGQNQVGRRGLIGKPGRDKMMVAINSHPGGAKVILDGQDTGRVTPVLAYIVPGDHKIVLQMEGYAPTEQDISGTAGQMVPLTLSLQPKQ